MSEDNPRDVWALSQHRYQLWQLWRKPSGTIVCESKVASSWRRRLKDIMSGVIARQVYRISVLEYSQISKKLDDSILENRLWQEKREQE